MKFSPKLPAVYTKRIVSRAIKIEPISEATENVRLSSNLPLDKARFFSTLLSLHRGIGSFSELKSVLKLNQYTKQRSFSNDLPIIFHPNHSAITRKQDDIVGKRSYSTASSDGVSNTKISTDMSGLLSALPQGVRDGSVLNFPLLNPWRSGQLHESLTGTEAEFQFKREGVLDDTFPVSKFPSVSKILQTTQSDMARENLDKWKKGMIEKLGDVGFINHQRRLFYRGQLFHRHIAAQLKGEKLEKIPPEIEQLWSSLGDVWSNISDVQALEQPVTHPFLCYKGILDCVALYEGDLVVIDWKTSSKQKPSLYELYDEPVQAAAYLGALNYDKNVEYQVDKMTVIVAYDDGQPATVHRISHRNSTDYWRVWLDRLKTYWDTLKN
ncbi:Mitochondrial genome maintenance exonuclease 1 [Halotydeus destructor]|nr:Mitochondrial genome maintenance exonuclease 1 [Halotydeus destructor]